LVEEMLSRPTVRQGRPFSDASLMIEGIRNPGQGARHAHVRSRRRRARVLDAVRRIYCRSCASAGDSPMFLLLMAQPRFPPISRERDAGSCSWETWARRSAPRHPWVLDDGLPHPEGSELIGQGVDDLAVPGCREEQRFLRARFRASAEAL